MKVIINEKECIKAYVTVIPMLLREPEPEDDDYITKLRRHNVHILRFLSLNNIYVTDA